MEMDPALYKEKMQEKRRRQHEAKKKRAEERWAAATPGAFVLRASACETRPCLSCLLTGSGPAMLAASANSQRNGRR